MTMKKMATTKQRARKASKKQKSPRVARKTSATKTKGRALKIYRLVNGIPEDVRQKSAAMAILKAIEKHGSATRPVIREELPKNFKEPTLGFYLGKFQRDKTVAAT